jgi:hypothetical protein
VFTNTPRSGTENACQPFQLYKQEGSGLVAVYAYCNALGLDEHDHTPEVSVSALSL